MKKIIFSLCMIVFMHQAFVCARSLTVAEVLAEPDLFDGMELVLQGEAIGSPLKTDSGAGVWFNIVSDGAHIGVFSAQEETVALITHWGDYRRRGDIVSVAGTFHTQCPQHHSADIHLEELTIVQQGFYFDNRVSAYKQNGAVVALLICLTVALIYFIKSRKRSLAANE